MGNCCRKPSTPPSPTTTTTIDLSRLRAELECIVCMDLFKEPKNLPCGHICCASCVQGVIDVAEKPVLFINCPQCRAELQVPADGQFPTAFVVKDLVALIKQVDGTHSEGQHDNSEASNPIVASKKRIFSIRLENVVSADVDVESIWMRIWLALFRNPDNALALCCDCEENNGETMRIRLDQLDKFLNEQVEGAVHRVSFECVQFDEPMVQMLRRVKRERFQHVDANGMKQMFILWENCDFSRISEASFRFLLGELFSPALIYIGHWTGLPTGFDYNALFQLNAFRDAWYIQYYVGRNIKPNSPMHLNSDVLIDFLHMPGYRGLNLLDVQLHDGFDSFLDRLIERFTQDTEFRFYALTVLVLNATKETKERLKLDEQQVLKHPENMGTLKLEWKKATGVNIGSDNTDNVFEFHANRN